MNISRDSDEVRGCKELDLVKSESYLHQTRLHKFQRVYWVTSHKGGGDKQHTDKQTSRQTDKQT